MTWETLTERDNLADDRDRLWNAEPRSGGEVRIEMSIDTLIEKHEASLAAKDGEIATLKALLRELQECSVPAVSPAEQQALTARINSALAGTPASTVSESVSRMESGPCSDAVADALRIADEAFGSDEDEEGQP